LKITLLISILYFTERLGEISIVYFDPHPTQGFHIMHRQPGLPDSYFISTRQQNPDNLNQVIQQAVAALGLRIEDFKVTSKDFGKIQIGLYTYINAYNVHVISHSLIISTSFASIQVVKRKKIMEICK
jgi:hypothetical protein